MKEGKFIGDSSYRVGEYLWSQAEIDTEKAKVLDQ